MPPDDFTPETDEHGFAPTKVVNARISRRGGRVHFFRVWMKPGDLAFPTQERRILGGEEKLMQAKYAKAREAGDVGGTVRLDAGRGMPPNAAGVRAVGDSGKNFATSTEKSSPSLVFFSWSCPHCHIGGTVNAKRDAREPQAAFHARLTAHCFDQHKEHSERCISDELTIAGTPVESPTFDGDDAPGEHEDGADVVTDDDERGPKEPARPTGKRYPSVEAMMEDLRDDAKYEEAKRMAAESTEPRIFKAAHE